MNNRYLDEIINRKENAERLNSFDANTKATIISILEEIPYFDLLTQENFSLLIDKVQYAEN